MLGLDLNSPEIKKNPRRPIFVFTAHRMESSFSMIHLSTNGPYLMPGFFAQSLMLAAHAHGIGTVPQGFLIDYSSEIKQFLGIPESKRLVLGISIGYPDMENVINTYRTTRVETEKILRWVE